jgi:hypothetical protein
MPAPLIAAALASIAPQLAKKGLDLLGGIFRGAINEGTKKVANLIEEKTGIDINDVVENKLSDAQWAKLKEFEFQHQTNLLEYLQQTEAAELDSERMKHADRADARDLQKKALESDNIVAKNFIYFYAAGITILTFVFIFWAAFIHEYAVNDPASRITDTVLGFMLGVTLSAIIQYFYGSSHGSKSKDERPGPIATTLTTQIRKP